MEPETSPVPDATTPLPFEAANDASSELIEGARYWQRRRRLLWVAVALAVLAALGVGIAIGSGVLRSSESPSASLEKAGIFHYATESVAVVLGPPSGPRAAGGHPMLVDLASGRERPIEQNAAYWYDPTRELLFGERIVDGTRVGESTQRFPDVGTVPSQEIALDELSTLGIRRVLSNREGTRAGGGSLYGRPVEWIRFQYSPLGFEVAVDMQTGQPLAVKSVCAACAVDPRPERLVDVGHVKAVPAGLSRTPTAPGGTLGLAGGGLSSRSVPTSLAFSGAARSLSRPALYAGKTFGGVELRATHLVVTTTTFRGTDAEKRSHSLEFGYGSGPLARTSAARPSPTFGAPLTPLPPSVTILETTTPGAGGDFYRANGHVVALGVGLSAAPIPPQGQALLGAPSPTTGITELWLRRGGLYITIQASSPKLALDAARHLRRVP